jgi:hypothetical protein
LKKKECAEFANEIMKIKSSRKGKSLIVDGLRAKLGRLLINI